MMRLMSNKLFHRFISKISLLGSHVIPELIETNIFGLLTKTYENLTKKLKTYIQSGLKLKITLC